jgi:hypothetical protein
MPDPTKRDEQSGGQRNADSHTNSGQKRPEQQTSSGPKSDAERAWAEGGDATGGDTPLDAGGSSADIEGADPSGAVSTNRERDKPWQVGAEDKPVDKQTTERRRGDA